MPFFPDRSSLPTFALGLLLSGCAAPETTQASSAANRAPVPTAQATDAGHKVLRVGASPVPHAEILEFVKPKLAQQGLDLQIVEFTDYVQPNMALAEGGSLDLNYFQHQPYLDQFQADRPLGIVGGAKIHVEPLGLYSSRYRTVQTLPDHAVIAISSDPSNSGRALKLLEQGGLISVNPKAGIRATVLDITGNPKQLEFRELEPAQLPRSLEDVDAAVINTNYALEAHLNPLKDSLLLEDAHSPYANLLAGKPAMLNDPRYLQLVKALQSDEVRQFMLDRYKGAVVPAF